MKKVLFITTHFAPDIHVGAKRMTKFARHLTDYGWQPVILTKDVSRYHGVDETLLHELPPDLSVHRVSEWHLSRRRPQLSTINGGISSTQNKGKTNGLRTRLMQVQNYFLFYNYSWLLPAFFAARRLIRQEGIRIVYSSAPDHEAHMAALLLRQTMPVKWVCEFRDPWTTVHKYYSPSVIQRKSDRYIERLVLRCSDHIISVGQMLKQELVKLGDNLCHDKVSVIYNGYDKDDFIDSNSTVTKDSRCVITYAGTWGPGRSPEHFLKALNMLLQRSPEMRGNLQVNFIGEFKYSLELEKETRHYIEQANMNDVITIIPWLPYKEALAKLLASDILLLVERPETSTNNNFWVVTSKVFLYLYARKPILALLPSGGEAARIIREADAGEIVPPTDIEAIANKISEMFGRFKKGELRSRVKLSDIDKYDRRKQTGELAAIFNNQMSGADIKNI